MGTKNKNFRGLAASAAASLLMAFSANVQASSPDSVGVCRVATTTSFPEVPAAPINDFSTTTDTVEVGGVGNYILDVDVTTNITHTWNGDLDITLTSPMGTVVTLTTDNGSGNDDVFAGTTWDDDAGDITAPGAVTDHAFTNFVAVTALVPEEALAAFVGEDPNGVWTLSISDDAGGDTGTLHNWSVVVTTQASAPPVNVPGSFTSSPVTAINDNATITEIIEVSGLPPYLSDVNVLTNITHTFSADLEITLTSPAGTVVTLTTDNGGGNDDVFAGTTWDDDAGDVTTPGAVTDHSFANAVIATPLVAEEALGAFIGEDPNGVWTLSISDDAGLDQGTLHSWGLNFVASSCDTAPVPCPAAPLPGCKGMEQTKFYVYDDELRVKLTMQGGKSPSGFAGNPRKTHAQTVCATDSVNGNVMMLSVAAGGVDKDGDPLWKKKDGDSDYRNKPGNEDGVNTLEIVTGQETKLFLMAEDAMVDSAQFGNDLTIQGIATNTKTLSQSCIEMIVPADEVEVDSKKGEVEVNYSSE